MEDLFGLVGHHIENRYAVDAVVAAGGFGVVYHATHAALGLPVALKVLKFPATLPEHLHGAFTEQFLGEAKIISALQHPAIVRVTDFGVITFHNGYRSPWMALEWIDGVTLAKDLERRRGQGGRSPRECLDLLLPVLDALAFAHAKGIAHRDIKPANLMLPALDPALASAQGARVSRNAAPRMRLLDFGIAKVLHEGDGPASGQTLTASQMASYSPRYAAPEQASGTRTGPWTDVHALALVLTELLVDAAPYTAIDKMELQIQVMAARRPTPASFGLDVGAWEPVLARALSLRPAERYANAGELLAALEAVVPEATWITPGLVTPDGPGPASTTGPTTRSVPVEAPRRARWPWAAAALFACSVVGGGLIYRGASGDVAPVRTGPPAPLVVAPPPLAAPTTQAAHPLAVPTAQIIAPAAPSPAATVDAGAAPAVAASERTPSTRDSRLRVRAGRNATTARPATATTASTTSNALPPPDRNRPW